MKPILVLISVVAAVPLPTKPQLNYQLGEIVALTHFNMATFFRDGDPACNATNWDQSRHPASFAPSNLNISNWIESYQALGVSSAILTAKHGCGFFLWPTSVTFPDGRNYGYHVGGPGGIGVDVVKEFTEKMKAAGLPYSFYFSFKDNFYLNALNDVVTNRSLLPGQVNLTQPQFEDVHLAAVKELWSSYGPLTEIWFDGGINPRIAPRITALLSQYQPQAVGMGAGIENWPHDVSWVGTESGLPAYPIWSLGCAPSGKGSRGDPNSNDFCPKQCDVTLQTPAAWFWLPNHAIHTLAELQAFYHATVGSNGVLEIDFAIDRTGRVDPAHAARYREFGNWIRSCYGTPIASSGNFVNTNEITLAIPSTVSGLNRAIIQEDLSHGQLVRSYTLEVQSSQGVWTTWATGTSVGHKRIVLNQSTSHPIQLRLRIPSSVGTPWIRLQAFDAC